MKFKCSYLKASLWPLLFVSAICLVLLWCDGRYLSFNAKKVTVAIELPDLLEKPRYAVTYRSHKCQSSYRDGDFKKHYTDDSSVRTYIPERENNGNVYSLTVPVEKGWYCDWKLSNVEFKLEYKEGSEILKGIDNTIFERITFLFDGHYPQATNGLSERVPEKIRVINEDFYPFKQENHLIGNLVTLSFTGRADFYTYRLKHDIDYILFKPIIHADEMVTSIDPLTWGHGEKMTLVYPDGSVVLGNSEPDFSRLKKISNDSKRLSE